MAGEFDLIARFFRPLAGPEGLGLLDDAACLKPTSGKDLIITKDMLVEDVHFRGADAAGSVAHKALAVNLSDLAAKGAIPRQYFLGLSIPKAYGQDWIAAFAAGLARAQLSFGLTLAGGDTTQNPDRAVVSVTMVGEVPSGAMVRRAGAAVGDTLYVSGSLGDAALGLKCLTGSLPRSAHLEDRYLHPQPRLTLGKGLTGVATACADVSDGLMADLGHICRASGVGAVVKRDSLPLSAAAASILQADEAFWPAIFSGGDDYELLFTAPEAHRDAVASLAQQSDTPITPIGHITRDKDVRLVDLKGELLQTDASGFDHFA